MAPPPTNNLKPVAFEKGATLYNVAVDVGGTFTDVLIFDEETGGLTEGKVLSTPEDPSKGVVEG
ncbi:MAG: hypothetical protein M3491_13395, partial [Actinomycetota bacterium]|nr:hypothetical protein [Actinomycetota bacterium]